MMPSSVLFVLPQPAYGLSTFQQHWYFPIAGRQNNTVDKLRILNTGSQTINYRVRFYYEDGTLTETTYSIGPSRYTSHDLPEANCAIMIMVDLPLGYDGYVTPQLDLPKDGYATTYSGANKLAKDWYYAAGYIGDFAYGLVGLLNPSYVAISVTIDVYGTDGTSYQTTVSVNPHSVKYQNLRDLPGVIWGDIAVEVSSISYFVASYMQIDLSNGVATGDNMANSPQKTWYFAGVIKSSSESFLFHILNPNTAAANVKADFGCFSYTFSIGPNRKLVWNGAPSVPLGSYSVKIESDIGVVATLEYWYVHQAWVLGSASNNGAPLPVTSWFYGWAYGWSFASSMVSVFNPSISTATINAVLYYADGSTSTKTYALPSGQRQDLDFYDAAQDYFGLGLYSDVQIVAQEYLWWWHENSGTLGAPMAKLTVRVYDDSGYALSGAYVSIRYSGSFIPAYGSNVASGTTDSDGAVVFSLQAAETYLVTASQTGYYSSSSTLTLTSNSILDFYLSPGEGGGGCPYVSVWDGNHYVLENNVLPTSEVSNGSDVEDYYKLEQTLVPVYQNRHFSVCSLMISEFEREHSYIDQVKLLAIDHSSNVNIALTPSGKILTYKNPVAPLSAVDNNGIDRLSKIRLMDGNICDQATYFDGFLNDYLVLNFGQVDSDSAKLIVRDDRKCMETCILVQVVDGNDEWQTVAELVPRAFWGIEAVDLSAYVKNDQDFWMRLLWTSPHRLDFVGLDTTKQDNFELYTANLVSAIHSTSGNVRPQLLENDNNYAELLPSEQIQLTFMLPNNTKQARAYILYTKGHYYTIP